MKYKYSYIIIKIDNIDECEKVQDLAFKFNIGWRDKILKQYNNCLVNESNTSYYSFSKVIIFKINMKGMSHNPYPSSHIDNLLRSSFCDPKLYNYNDLNDVESILRYGRIAPSYKPRRKR